MIMRIVLFVAALSVCVAAPIAPSNAQSARARAVLTFDDADIAAWYQMRPLLKRYGAQVTFFVHKASFTDSELTMLQTLQNEGHDVSLHSVAHANILTWCPRGVSSAECASWSPATRAERYFALEAQPQIRYFERYGLSSHGFAYPYNSSTTDSLSLFSKLFSYQRTGSGPTSLVTRQLRCGSDHKAFIGGYIDNVSAGGRGLPNTTIAGQLANASATGTAAMFYGHRYYYPGRPAGGASGVSADRLEYILRTAAAHRVAVVPLNKVCGWETSAPGSGVWTPLARTAIRPDLPILFADVTGDNREDVVKWNGSSLSVWKNQGDGSLSSGRFEALPHYGAAAPYFPVFQAIDVNADGSKELVYGNTRELFSVDYRNRVGRSLGLLPFAEPVALLAGDLNPDRLEDLFVVSRGGVSKWMHGSQAPSAIAGSTLHQYRNHVLTDFDMDGVDEVVMSNGSQVLMAKAPYVTATPLATAAGTVLKLFVGSVSRPFARDVVAAVSISGQKRYFSVKAGGVISELSTLAGTSLVGLPDLNGDGAAEYIKYTDPR